MGRLGAAVLWKLHDNALSSSSRWKSHTLGTCKHRSSSSGSQKSIEATEPRTQDPGTPEPDLKNEFWKLETAVSVSFITRKTNFENWNWFLWAINSIFYTEQGFSIFLHVWRYNREKVCAKNIRLPIQISFTYILSLEIVDDWLNKKYSYIVDCLLIASRYYTLLCKFFKLY